MGKIYLACRNEAKVQAAKHELEQESGKRLFEIILMDVSVRASVRAAFKLLPRPIDALVMNAGRPGGTSPIARTKDGVTGIFATYVLGHVILLDHLIASSLLTRAAACVGSEAARGVPKLGMKRPELPTSSVQDFVDVFTGKNFSGKKFDGALAYCDVKYIAALWMAAAARRHCHLHLLTVSPGNTYGTNHHRWPACTRCGPRALMKHVFMPFIAPLSGMAHSRIAGAARMVRGLTDASLKNGVFYGVPWRETALGIRSEMLRT